LVAPPGSIAYASGVLIGAPGNHNIPLPVAYLSFCSYAPGDAVFHWQFSPPAPTNRNSEIAYLSPQIVSDPATYSDNTISVVTGTLGGQIYWQGRPNNSPLQQLPISLTLQSTSGPDGADYPAQNTDDSGSFPVSLGTLPDGLYFWRVKGHKYLANRGTVTINSEPAYFVGMGAMRVGDSNDDNVVNAQDFTMFKPAFGTRSGDPGYDERAEFTGDSLVSIIDFVYLKLNYDQAGAPPISP